MIFTFGVILLIFVVGLIVSRGCIRNVFFAGLRFILTAFAVIAAVVWILSQQRDGYQDGLDDADMYDEGYYDGKNKHKPKYFNDSFYMDGFKDGKKQR